MGMYENHQPAARADLRAAHEIAWSRLAGAGTWFDGQTRAAIVAELRHASDCALCQRSKKALSPTSVVGVHDSLGLVATELIDVIHRLRHDAARITKSWVDDISITDGEYVELIAVVATTLAVDGFTDTLGWPRNDLPSVQPGTPSRRRPVKAKLQLAWVPTVHPQDVVPGEVNPYENVRGVHIHQALSLVAEEVVAFFELDAAQYLPGSAVRDFANEHRALSHQQIELLAARVAAINQCVY